VYVSSSGSLDIRGGLIGDSGLFGLDDARIHMSGGIIEVNGVELWDRAQMHWNGGEISVVYLYQTPTFTIAGTSFQLDGTPLGYGPVSALSGTLTGTLANGDPFSLPFQRQSSAHLILVPEPSTCLLLGAGLVALSRRRRGALRADAFPAFPVGG
jgi:hypothetical protein